MYGTGKTWLRAAATESKVALPFAVVLALLLWRLTNNPDILAITTLIVCALTAVLWIAIDKKYALIRVRSQSISTLYAFLAATLLFPRIAWSDAAAALCLCAAYYFLFGAYQQPRAVGHVFHAFLCLSLGSLFFTPLILFAPCLIFYVAHHARALSWRTWWAAVVGLVTPYWFKAAWIAYNGGFAWVADACRQIGDLPPSLRFDFHAIVACIPHPLPAFGLQPIDYNVLLHADWTALTALGLMVLFTVIAAIHYRRTSFNDKIRTRIFLYMLIWQNYFILAFILLQPTALIPLFAVMVMNSAPLLAHHYALGRGRPIDIAFLILFLSCLTLYAYGLFRNLYD